MRQLRSIVFVIYAANESPKVREAVRPVLFVLPTSVGKVKTAHSSASRRAVLSIQIGGRAFEVEVGVGRRAGAT